MAAFICGDCDSPLCTECVWVDAVHAGVQLWVCSHCRGRVEPLKLHRSAVPYRARVLAAWQRPLTQGGLISMIAAAAVIGFLGWMFKMAPFALKPFMAICWLGTFWAYIFKQVRDAARGNTDFEAPDFRDIFIDLIAPTFRGLVATAPVWGLGLYLYFRDRHAGLLHDPVAWLVIAGCFLMLPMAILQGALDVPIWRLLNPLFALGYARQIGTDYLIALAATAVDGALFLACYGLDALVSRVLPIPVIAPWLGEAIGLYPAMVLAQIIGILLYVRGDAIGYGMESDYYEPVAPDAKPHREAPPLAPAQANAGPRTISLADAPRPADPVGALREAAARGDGAGAFRAIRALPPETIQGLGPNLRLAAARGAADAGDFPRAVEWLKAIGQQLPDSPEAPQACLLLAELYGGPLRDPAIASRLLRHLVARYPAHPEATTARQRLGEA